MTHFPARGVLLGDTETSGHRFQLRRFLDQVQSIDFYLIRWDADGVLDETQPVMPISLPAYMPTGPHSVVSLGAHRVHGLSNAMIANQASMQLPHEAALALQSSLKRLIRQGIALGFYNGSRFDCDVMADFLERHLCDGRRLFPYHPYLPDHSGMTDIPSWQRQPLQFDLMHAARIFEYFYPDSFKPVDKYGQSVENTGKISRSLLARVAAMGGTVDAAQAHGVEYDVRVLSRDLFLRLWEIDKPLMRAIIACTDKQAVMRKLHNPVPEPIFVVTGHGKAGWFMPVLLPPSRREAPYTARTSFERGKVYLLPLDADAEKLEHATVGALQAMINKREPCLTLAMRDTHLIIGQNRASAFNIPLCPDATAVKTLVMRAVFQERFFHAALAANSDPNDAAKPQRPALDWTKRRKLRDAFHHAPWEEREAIALAMDDEDRARAVHILFMQQCFRGSATPLLTEAGLVHLTIAPLDPLLEECRVALKESGDDPQARAAIEKFLASETAHHRAFTELRNTLAPARAQTHITLITGEERPEPL